MKVSTGSNLLDRKEQNSMASGHMDLGSWSDGATNGDQ